MKKRRKTLMAPRAPVSKSRKKTISSIRKLFYNYYINTENLHNYKNQFYQTDKRAITNNDFATFKSFVF